MTCRSCSATELADLWTARGYPWVKCKACGSLQTTRVLSPDELAEYYSNSYYEGFSGRADQGAYLDYVGQRGFIQANLKRRVDWVLKTIKGRGDWLDVGCAAGFLMDTVRDYGFTPWGIDYSDYGPTYARNELGLSGAAQATLETLPEQFPSQFQTISFIDVLEHTTHQQNTLIQCAELVAPGGYLVGETFDPASMLAHVAGPYWHAIDPPNHFGIISLKAVDQTLNKQGMTYRASVRLPRILSIGSIASKFGAVGNRISRWIYRRNWNHVGIPIWLGDVVLWVYQKSG